MLHLEIVTPTGPLLSEDVDEVVAPGTEGEFGVLPGHIPFITLLDVGECVYKKDGKPYPIFINSGYAEISNDRVTILAESAEKAEQIDAQRAEAALKRAEERLKAKQEGIDFTRTEASLKRSLIRLQMSKKYSNFGKL
ncbi:MAG TPA: F0F1 ATP synthase subunit epsilon [Thermodesulfovibrionia bacterium]|nr:F0F1 ATP synthase subunit epsilon [Thermodesulfovibrionia bacterium]